MRSNFNLARQGLITCLFITLSLSTYSQSRKELWKQYETNLQSKEYLRELHYLVKESLYLTKNWVFIDKISATPDKLRLEEIHRKYIPGILSETKKLSEEGKWNNVNNLPTSKQHSLIRYSLCKTLL